MEGDRLMAEVLFRIVDLETSGKKRDEGAEVCEVGLTDLKFDTETKQSVISLPTAVLYGVEKPLTPEVMAVHHIQNHHIADLPRCTDAILRAVVQNGSPMFIVAHQWEFEAQWFTPEILGEVRPICTMKNAYRLFDEGPHSNQALKYELGLGDLPDELCMPPHRAGPDTYVTAHILAWMLTKVSVNEMVQVTRAPRYYARCPLARFKNKRWEDVEHGFLSWMLKQPDMEPDLKAAATEEINRRYRR